MRKRIAAVAAAGVAMAAGTVAFALPASATVDCVGAACNNQTTCADFFGPGMQVLSEVRLNTEPISGYLGLRRTGCQAFVAEVQGVRGPRTVWLNDYGVLQPDGTPTRRGTRSRPGDTTMSLLWAGSPMQACVTIARGPAAGTHCTAVMPL